MSRAAILPYPGDPFLLNYWLHFFDTIWGDEVDRLYIHLNSSIEESVVEYIRELCEKRPKVKFIYTNFQMEHGQVINISLDLVEEEYIMLVEDDCFIFKKGVIDNCFKFLEDGGFDIVGSKRGSCAMEILSRASQLWGLNYEGEGDQGCNFWPNLFFSTKAKLLTTDRWFGAKSWVKGENISALDQGPEKYLVQGDVAASDTFVWASLQLQATTPQSRIKYIPQYHGSPDDLDHMQRSYNLFDGVAPWVHVGSLSSGVGGILQDGNGRSLSRRTIDTSKGENVQIPNYCHTEQEKNEFERRVQWWQKFAIYWNENDNKENSDMCDFWFLYTKALDQVIQQYQLNPRRIERRQRAYATLGL